MNDALRYFKQKIKVSACQKKTCNAGLKRSKKNCDETKSLLPSDKIRVIHIILQKKKSTTENESVKELWNDWGRQLSSQWKVNTTHVIANRILQIKLLFSPRPNLRLLLID